MSKKKKLADILKEKLDFPLGCGGGESGIEIMGGKCVRVHGCSRILEYGDTLISVATAEGRLEISGSELYCTSYMSGAIEISGRITSVGFSEVPTCR